MSLHGKLFDGPLPAETRTEPPWPGYDEEPAEDDRPGVLDRLFRRRTARHAA
jgi:hypothetical protein